MYSVGDTDKGADGDRISVLRTFNGKGCEDCSKAEADPSVLHRTFWHFFFPMNIKTLDKTAD